MNAAAAPSFESIITVTLNTAIDRIIAAPGLAIGAHLVGRRLARQPAGKGVNVSRALAALNVANIATGFVGEDELAEFEKLGDNTLIRPQFLALPGHTRENITLIDPEHATETHVRTDGAPVTERDLDRLRRKLNLMAKPGALVVFAGSLPPGVSASDVVGLVEQVESGGAAVAVDCAPEAMAAVMQRPLWLAKCNRAEFAAALQRELKDEDALVSAGRRASETVETWIVTCGSAGAYAFTRGIALMAQVDVDDRAVVSTVGCGDALLAGFIAARQNGRSVSDAFGAATAVATAAAISAVPGEFRAVDVEKFAERTSVITLA